MNAGIKYIVHSSIDKEKWDACIGSATNSRIYGYSFYLDHMVGEWDALVLGDYEAVMPLTWKKKYGVHYLYQPFLAAQLGVFGNNIGEQIVNDFIKTIPAKFKLIEIALNSSNFSEAYRSSIYTRMNYVLDLDKPYEEISQSYRDNIKRNIRKAKQVGCSAEKGFDVEKVITLAVDQMHGYGKQSGENVDRFRRLYHFLLQKQMAVTYGILSPHGELIASAVFLIDDKRAYYILVGNHPNGKTIGASHALIDEFIRDHAGRDMVLDFEGSDIRNLAFFYSSFGAKEEVYPFLRVNRLPVWLRWMK